MLLRLRLWLARLGEPVCRHTRLPVDECPGCRAERHHIDTEET